MPMLLRAALLASALLTQAPRAAECAGDSPRYCIIGAGPGGIQLGCTRLQPALFARRR